MEEEEEEMKFISSIIEEREMEGDRDETFGESWEMGEVKRTRL